MNKKLLLALFVIGAIGFGLTATINPVSAETKQGDLVFWTTETEAWRVDIIEDIAASFAGATVDVVAIDENDFPEQVVAAQAAGTLPDVMQVFYEYIGGYAAEGILDAERATTTIGGISDLGGLPMTVNPASTGASDMYGAVPIDGWIQGIWYRTDLFAAEGLSPPNTYDRIMTAAETLHNVTDPLNPMYGIVIGTDPKAVYTQQVYEHFALANGARAFDENGNVILNNERQVEALEYYVNLSAYAPEGFNDWDAANQLYLTNKTAMMVYSTFIADDILGLQARPWTPIPNLGDITEAEFAITGLHGDTATYGQLSALGISVDAHAQSENFIKHILNDDDNYLDWLHMAITGKMPLKQSPGIIANWTGHEIWGSYTGLADSILTGFESVARWGLVGGHSYAVQVSKLYGELIMPKAIVSVISNITDAESALAKAEADLKDVLGIATTPGFGAALFFASLLILVIFVGKKRRK